MHLRSTPPSSTFESQSAACAIIHPPKLSTLPRALHLESFQTLSRLRLVPPFNAWLTHMGIRSSASSDSVAAASTSDLSPVRVLFHAFSYGAPLWCLLELLGGPVVACKRVTVPLNPAHTANANANLLTSTDATRAERCRTVAPNPEDFDFAGVRMEERRAWVEAWIASVALLEGVGRVRFGEVVRAEDFFGGGGTGYARVLRSVKRVLGALEESYPGLFVVPHGAAARRASLLQQLIGGERVHVSRLADVTDAASRLYTQTENMTEVSLEAFIVTCSRLIPYHNLVLQGMEEVVVQGAEERWDEVFSFTNKVFRTNIFTAYRALCANFIPFSIFLERAVQKNPMDEAPHIIRRHLSMIIGRIAEYHTILQAILDVTTPTTPFYDDLCLMTFEMSQLSSNINEVGTELRTMWACRFLPARLRLTPPAHPSLATQRSNLSSATTKFDPTADLDMDSLGSVIFDDRLMVDPIAGAYQEVLLFEKMLLCCGETGDEMGSVLCRYPVKDWELGIGLAQACGLVLVHAVPVDRMSWLRCVDEAYFEVCWVDTVGMEQVLVFYPTMPMQYTQWVTYLAKLVPRILHSSSSHPNRDQNLDFDEYNDEEKLIGGPTLNLFTADETMYERRQSTARPWSVIGRKGSHSESSSLALQMQSQAAEQESVLSAGLLPDFFSLNGKAANGGVSQGNGALSPGGSGRTRGGRGHSRHRSAKSPLGSNFTRDDLAQNLSGYGFLGISAAVGQQESEAGPPVVDLTGDVVKEGNYPVAHGGHSDIWKAVWAREGKGMVEVAVKVLRTTTEDRERQMNLVKRIHHEMKVWRQLHHPHVLPLCGVVSDFGPVISMVCPWAENGSVTRYLERCGDILSVQDRLRIISEIAEGLAYLHLCSVIHGDLTGSNVLLTKDLKAQLCDFGLSTIVMQSNAQTPDSFTSGLGGAVRWADSALFLGLHDASDGRDDGWRPPPLTCKSDVYSLGSVMLEVLSGRLPYHYIATDAQVVIELHKGNKPRRPTLSFVDDEQWEIIQWCWTQPPEDRPDALDVAERIVDMVEKRVGETAPPAESNEIAIHSPEGEEKEPESVTGDILSDIS